MNKEEKNLRKIRFKNMTLKEKASYLFMYYKFHALALLFLSVFIISLIASMISGSREISFYASFTNADISFDFDGYAADFAAYAGIDTENTDIIMDTSIWTASDNLEEHSDITVIPKMMAAVSTGDMDVVVGNETLMNRFADAGFFQDLRTVLPAEYITKYEPYFYYYAYDEQAHKLEAADRGVSYESTIKGPFDTTEPIPVGIRSEAFSNLPEDFLEGNVLSVAATAPRIETILKFIDFLE